MTTRIDRWLVVAAASGALAAAGCAAVPVDPDSGFRQVSTLVEERAGLETWSDGGREDDPRRIIRERIDDGIDVEEAVAIAVVNNRELRAVFSDLGVAQSDLVQASLLHNPIADVAAGFPVSGGVVDVSFGIAMDVVDLFYVPARKRVAEAELEQVKIRVAGEVLDLAWRTRRGFYRHVASRQMLEMRRQVAESTAASWELTRRMRDAGNVTALEVENERALAEEARLDLRSAEMAVDETREELTTLMGLWGENAGWEASTGRLPEPPAEEIDLDGVERRAIARSLDLEMAEMRVVAAGEQLGLNRSSALFPEVLVGGEGSREGDWEAGPSLSLPLPFFDRGQARVARAREELRRARELHHALAVRVRSTARAIRERARGHRERAIHYRDVLLPVRERIVRETQLQYNAMQLAPFDLLRARERQIETGERYIESLRDFWLARSDLELLLAGRLPAGEGGAPPADAIDSPRRSPIPTLN